MPCEEYRELIQRFVDSDLSEKEYDELHSHCISCKACATYFQEILTVSDSVKQLAPEELPNELHQKLMNIPNSSSSEKVRSLRIWSTVIAATLLIVIGIGTGIGFMFNETKTAGSDLLTTEIDTYASLAQTEEPNPTQSDNTLPITTAATVPATTVAATVITQAPLVNNYTYITTAAPVILRENIGAEETDILDGFIDQWVSEAALTREYSFVQVMRMDAVPRSIEEYEEYIYGEYANEHVGILFAELSLTDVNTVMAEEYIHWTYQTNFADSFTELKLSGDAPTGLFIVLVPEGAR